MYANRTLRRASLLIFAIMLIASAQAAAQAGQLDPTFGQGGIVTTDFGNQSGSNIATANAVALQPDGKIVVCGGAPGSSGFSTAAIARYNPDGSLDKKFGNAGITVTQNELNVPSSIALQTDGKIVVAGFANAITVIRYTPNGSLDSRFGKGGIVSTGFLFSSGRLSGVVVQSDGKIVVAGGPLLLRLLPDGQTDPNFGTGNGASLAGDAPTALALLPNGKFLVASAAPPTDAGEAGGFVTRYKSNGSVDTSFGIDGQLGTTGPANGMNLLSNGEFLIGGSLMTAARISEFAVSRYLGFGATDAKFGTHGGVVTPLANFPTIVTSNLDLQSSGDIVTLGTASANGSTFVFALARYTPTGKLDPTFGTNGVVTTSFGSDYVNANALAIQSDDKIVAVGSYIDQFDTGFKLTRYLGH